jgi:hypothetical protein
VFRKRPFSILLLIKWDFRKLVCLAQQILNTGMCLIIPFLSILPVSFPDHPSA